MQYMDPTWSPVKHLLGSLLGTPFPDFFYSIYNSHSMVIKFLLVLIFDWNLVLFCTSAAILWGTSSWVRSKVFILLVTVTMPKIPFLLSHINKTRTSPMKFFLVNSPWHHLVMVNSRYSSSKNPLLKWFSLPGSHLKIPRKEYESF